MLAAMTDDPRVLQPDHLPTPFTADEIRAGCPPGRTVRSLVVPANGEPFVRVTRFVSGDPEGSDQEIWTESPDGARLTEPERGRSSWVEFQRHASMPAATTTIDEQTIEIPAGRFDCLRYVRRDGDSVSTFWFARSAPGMPLKFERRTVDGTLVFSSTAIEDFADYRRESG
jgi:hypothetical protein